MTETALTFTSTVDPQHPNTVMLAVAGDLDMASSGLLESAIATAAESQPHEIVLDLRAVGFVDSTGLRVIISASQDLAGQGTRVCVDGLSGAAQRLLEITGVIEHLRR